MPDNLNRFLKEHKENIEEETHGGKDQRDETTKQVDALLLELADDVRIRLSGMGQDKVEDFIIWLRLAIKLNFELSPRNVINAETKETK